MEAGYRSTLVPDLENIRTRLDESEPWLQHMLQLAYRHGSEQAKHAHNRAKRNHDRACREVEAATAAYNEHRFTDAAEGLHRARHFCSLAEEDMRVDLGIHRRPAAAPTGGGGDAPATAPTGGNGGGGGDAPATAPTGGNGGGGDGVPAMAPTGGDAPATAPTGSNGGGGGGDAPATAPRQHNQTWRRNQRRLESGKKTRRGGRRSIKKPPPMNMPTCKVPTLFPNSDSGRTLHVWISSFEFEAVTNHARMGNDNTVQWDGDDPGFSLRSVVEFHANKPGLPKCVQSYLYYKWSGLLVSNGVAASWILEPLPNNRENLDKRFRNPGQELKLLYDKLLSDLNGEGTYPKKRRKVQRYLANLRAREREALILGATCPDQLDLATGLRHVIRAIGELPDIGGPGEVSEDGASDEMSGQGVSDEVSADQGQVPDNDGGLQALDVVRHALQDARDWLLQGIPGDLLLQRIPRDNVPAVEGQIPYVRRGIYHPANDLATIIENMSLSARAAVMHADQHRHAVQWWERCRDILGLFDRGQLMQDLGQRIEQLLLWYGNPHGQWDDLRATAEEIMRLSADVDREVCQELTYAPPGTLGPAVVVGIDPGIKVISMALIQVIDRILGPEDGGPPPLPGGEAGDGGPPPLPGGEARDGGPDEMDPPGEAVQLRGALYQEEPVMHRKRRLALTLPYRREKSGQAMQERSGKREARKVAWSIRNVQRPPNARGSPGSGGNKRGSAQEIMDYARDVHACWEHTSRIWMSVRHRRRNFDTHRRKYSVMDRFCAEVGTSVSSQGSPSGRNTRTLRPRLRWCERPRSWQRRWAPM